jgi:cytidylate kinase
MAVLILSREHQNGCVEIGKAVASQLNYEFVDRHSIYASLKTAGEKWGKLALELDEEPPTLWEQFDREYLGFIALIESTIYEAALRNRAVILGRGSAFILHDAPQALKVRLHAPLTVRIERRMNQEKEDRGTAEAYIERADKSRNGYVEALYGKKVADFSNYDLAYNTAIQTYDQVTRNLVEILENWDRKDTPESRGGLENRALAARAKARIFTHPEIFIPTLELFFDGRAIVIKGVVHNPMEYKLIREILHQTVDPHPIRNELHYRK